jgi:hypothetical protein
MGRISEMIIDGSPLCQSYESPETLPYALFDFCIFQKSEEIELLIIHPISNKMAGSTGGGRWPCQKAPIE